MCFTAFLLRRAKCGNEATQADLSRTDFMGGVVRTNLQRSYCNHSVLLSRQEKVYELSEAIFVTSDQRFPNFERWRTTKVELGALGLFIIIIKTKFYIKLLLQNGT